MSFNIIFLMTSAFCKILFTLKLNKSLNVLLYVMFCLHFCMFMIYVVGLRNVIPQWDDLQQSNMFGYKLKVGFGTISCFCYFRQVQTR